MAAPRRGMLLFVLAVLGFSLLLQGSRGLLEPDEGRYAEAAREMLVSGDWIVPRLADHAHFTKPPVTYWLTAAGLAAFGRNAWGARVPLGLATGLTALLAGLIAGRLFGREAFVAATVAHLLAFGPFLGGAILTTDAFLVLFETAGVYCFVEAWADGPRRERWAFGIFPAFGLAFLTKGPPGLLPLLALAVFVAWRGGGRVRRIWSPWGMLAGLAVGASWYVVVIAREPDLLRYFLDHEVVGRIASAEHHRNNPAVIYLATLAVGFLPWLVVLPFFTGGWRATLAWVGVRLRRPAAGEVRLLLLLWFLVPLTVFCLARSRLPLYVLPLFVPLAVGAAGLMHGISAASAATVGRPRDLRRFVAAWAVFLLVIKGVTAWVVPWAQDMRHLDAELRRLAPDAQAIIVGREPLNGLRFYRDGALTDWDDGPVAPPGASPIGLVAGLRAELLAAAAEGRRRVFVGQRRADWMVPGFAEAGLAPVAWVRGRAVFLLDPAGGPPHDQARGDGPSVDP